jgi:quercetin dioxygenase-like cupin family protein
VTSGRPGDHPINDLLDHGIAVYSPEADALVKAIAKLVPRYRLWELIDWFSPPPMDAFTAQLQKLHDDLVREARERGWEPLNDEILENPVTGEALRVLESTPAVFKVQYSLRPHGEIAGAHFHPGMQQKITVLSGEMHLRIDGAHRVVRAGESAQIPAGAHHFQWNPCDSEVVAIEEIRPAGRLHEFFSVLFGLARDGKTDSQGRPSLLLSAALFTEFKDSIRHAPFGTRVLLDGLAPIASLLGHRRQVDRYRLRVGTDSLARS